MFLDFAYLASVPWNILVGYAVALAGTALAAYTDIKTGLIYDRITYPMIAIGAVLAVAAAEWLAFAVAAAVFALGYGLYYAGKIGGGDVKLFVGISLLVPFVSGIPFIVGVLLVAAIASIVALSVYYVSRYAMRGIGWKEDLPGIIRAAFLAVPIGFYFFIIAVLGVISMAYIALLAVTVACGLAFVAFERGIRREFFLQKVRVSELEDDELIAKEFLDAAIAKKIGMGGKGVLGAKEIERLKKLGIAEVPVYRSLPKFAPFVFVGVAVMVVFGKGVLSLFMIG